MSSLIFFLKLNTQNLFVIFLKAKDYHSFPGTHDFIRHMLPSMFVLLQALLGEQWSFFFFLCYSFFQATARLRNGNNIAFWFKSYDGQSIRIRRNFLSEQKELCECCGQIFLSSPQWDLSSLLPSTLRMSANLLPELPKMCYCTQRKRISLKYCLCNFFCGCRYKCVGGGGRPLWDWWKRDCWMIWKY